MRRERREKERDVRKRASSREEGIETGRAAKGERKREL
jgi:hypothetical protein